MASVIRQEALAQCVSALLGANLDAAGGGSTPEFSVTFDSLRDGTHLLRLLGVEAQAVGVVGDSSMPSKQSSPSSSSSGSSSSEAVAAKKVSHNLAISKASALADVRNYLQNHTGSSLNDRELLRACQESGTSELASLISMVLSYVVQGEHKERFVKRIMQMDLKYQGEIMQAIKSSISHETNPKSPASMLIHRLTPKHKNLTRGSPSNDRSGESYEGGTFNDENMFSLPQERTNSLKKKKKKVTSALKDSPSNQRNNSTLLLARLRTLEQENVSLQKSNEAMSTTVARQRAQIETCRENLDKRTKDQHRALEQSENRAAERISELQEELKSAKQSSKDASILCKRLEARSLRLEAAEEEVSRLKFEAEEASKLRKSSEILKRRLDKLLTAKDQASESQRKLDVATNHIAFLESELPRKDAALRAAESRLEALDHENSILKEAIQKKEEEIEMFQEHCRQLSVSAKEWLGDENESSKSEMQSDDLLAGMPPSLVEFFSRAAVTPSKSSSAANLMQEMDGVGTPRAAQELMKRWTTARSGGSLSSPTSEYLSASPHTPQRHRSDCTPVQPTRMPNRSSMKPTAVSDATLLNRLKKLEERNIQLQKDRSAAAEADAAKISELKSKLQGERARISVLEAKLCDKEAEANSTYDRLSRELSMKTERAKEAEHDLQVSVRSSRENITRLEQELHTLKLTERTSQDKAKALAEELQLAKVESRTQKGKLQRALDDSENKARALQTELNIVQEDSARALEGAEERAKETNEKLLELRRQLSSSKEKYEHNKSQLETKVAVLTEELHEVRAQQIRAQRLASAADASNDATRRSLENRLNDAEERYTKAAKQADASVRQLKQCEESWKARVDTLQRDLREASNEIRVLQSKAKEKEIVFAEMTEQARLHRCDEAKKRSVAAEALSAEVSRLGALVEKLTEEVKSKDKIKISLQKDVERLRGNIAVHSRANEVAQAGRAAAESRASVAESEIENWASKYSQAVESLRAAEEQMRSAQAEKLDAKRAAEDDRRAANIERSNCAELQAKLRDAELLAEENEKKWRSKEKLLMGEMCSLRESECGARMARDTAQDCMKAAERELNALASVLREQSSVSSSSQGLKQEDLDSAVMEAEARVKRQAAKEKMRIQTEHEKCLTEVEEMWKLRLADASAHAIETQRDAVLEATKEAICKTKITEAARWSEETSERNAEVNSLKAELVKVHADAVEMKTDHTRIMKHLTTEKNSALGELDDVKSVLAETERRFVLVEKLQRFSETYRMALEDVKPGKSVQDSNAPKFITKDVSTMTSSDPTTTIPSRVAAEKPAQVVTSQDISKIESVWKKRVEDRDNVIERQARWRQKHMDNELQLVQTIDKLRQRVKDVKGELAVLGNSKLIARDSTAQAMHGAGVNAAVASTDASTNTDVTTTGDTATNTECFGVSDAATSVEAVGVSNAATNTEAVGIADAATGTEGAGMSDAATNTNRAFAADTTACGEDLPCDNSASSAAGGISMVEVLQHALRRLQAEFSLWRIEHDTRTGAALK